MRPLPTFRLFSPPQQPPWPASHPQGTPPHWPGRWGGWQRREESGPAALAQEGPAPRLPSPSPPTQLSSSGLQARSSQVGGRPDDRRGLLSALRAQSPVSPARPHLGCEPRSPQLPCVQWSLSQGSLEGSGELTKAPSQCCCGGGLGTAGVGWGVAKVASRTGSQGVRGEPSQLPSNESDTPWPAAPVTSGTAGEPGTALSPSPEETAGFSRAVQLPPEAKAGG